MIGVLMSYTYVGVLLLIAPKFEKYGKEYSRKFVHIMTVNWWFIVMVCFKTIKWPLLISISFLIGNLLTYKYSIFKAIEREEGRKDKGTIYYSMTLILLVIISYVYKDLYIGLIGSLIMGYGDGFAAIIGKTINWHPYHVGQGIKSISGNIAMCMISTLISWGILNHLEYIYSFKVALLIGVVATLVETVSKKGIDNLTVPLSSVGIYWIMIR